MVKYLLKKSYQLKDLKEINFNDLWGGQGVFTTMWIYGKPSKILFFKNHINNLMKSTRAYSIKKSSIRSDILKLLKKNINSKRKYNHLLRIALTKKTLSISLRKRIKPKLNFDLKLVNLKRQKPEYKNLKYKEILKHLSKLDNSKSEPFRASFSSRPQTQRGRGFRCNSRRRPQTLYRSRKRSASYCFETTL